MPRTLRLRLSADASRAQRNSNMRVQSPKMILNNFEAERHVLLTWLGGCLRSDMSSFTSLGLSVCGIGKGFLGGLGGRPPLMDSDQSVILRKPVGFI